MPETMPDAPATITELANLALDQVGETKRLQDLASDTTAVGKAVKAVFWQAWDETLRGYPWNCARKRKRVAALSQAPPFGPSRYYQLPADYIAMQDIDALLEGEQWSIETAEVGGDTVPVIACDIPPPLDITYTCRLRNPVLADPAFKGAFVFGLAFHVCVPLTKDRTLRAELFELWRQKMALGMAADARDGSRRPMPDSAVVTGRD